MLSIMHRTLIIFLFSHVRRECNFVTQILLDNRYALHVISFLVWIKDDSPQLSDIIQANLVSIQY